MAFTCSGCLKKITDRCFLTCTSCKHQYDLECANVSTQRFYNTMTPEHKQSWICQTCRCKVPKKDNLNSPIRPLENEYTNLTPIQNNNITMRKKQNFVFNDSSISDNSNLFGDTIQNESDPNLNLNCETVKEASKHTNLIDIEHFEKLLDRKLKENKQSLISELQSIVFLEVNKAISDLKIEMLEKTTTSQSELTKQKVDIQEINNTIHILEIENKKLQTEIQELQNYMIQTKDSLSGKNLEEHKTSCKKIVLHGLVYNYRETEYELYERVVNVFHDVMNVNLVTYIDDLIRIGRKGPNRPIVIELLSKRVTKFILENKYLFKNTGLAISEFLNPEALKKRKQLTDKLRIARKEGHHAVIKNNILLVDGKECTELCINTSSQHYSQDNTSDSLVVAEAVTTRTIPTKEKTFFRK